MARKCWTTIISLGVLGLLLAPLAVTAQTEGYDPMLQITHQFAKPNVLILLDKTGSMAYEQGPSGDSVGVDSFGLPELSWSVTVSGTTPSSYKGDACHWDRYGRPDRWYWICNATTYTYTYRLSATSRAPSRMDVFKNALGNSVPLYGAYSGSTYVSPTVAWPASWPTAYAGYTYIGSGRWTRAVTVPESTSGCTSKQPACGGPTAPDPPFDAAWTTPDYSQSPVVKPTIDGWNPNLTPTRLPQDLVGTSKRSVNWGLETYSTDGITERVRVKADDTISVQDAVAASIQTYMKPLALGGLEAGGSTNTSKALNAAKASLKATYDTGGPGGTQDPLIVCGRVYGVILVTDGESNSCNNTDCSRTLTWGCDSSYTNWASFPAGRGNELFLETSDTSTACTTCRSTATTPVPVRTFVVGVSSEVARCELNLVAYFGRTDASSPNGDAGMKIEKDYTGTTTPAYRLPLNVPSNYASMLTPPTLPTGLTVGTTSTSGNYRPVVDTCTADCKDYAFFANDPAALYDAFATILGAIGAGDYTTSAPVASSALGAGTVAILASTEFPLWKGHLYAFDTTKATTDAGYLMWDAGYNLRYSTGTAENPGGTTANPAYVAPSARKIYTWNPASGNALVAVTTANASTLNTICGSCGLDASVVNFIMGYNGASSTSTTIRPWVLGSTINSTPAITQAVETFLQGNLESHTAFETAHADRTPLAWVGADDGMLHAFKLEDGKEVLAIIPPNLLAKQVTLKNRYNAIKAPTGQPGLPSDHIYGLAGSPKYGDMWVSGAYKTVMLVSEGPGGNLIAGLDVTDPVGATGDPVSVLWSKTGSDWSGLYSTWSTPSGGASKPYNPSTGAASVWTGIVGAGFNPASTASSQVTPKALIFDPTTGALASGLSPTAGTVSSPGPLVGNQTFSDSVIYSMSASAFYADNIVNLALQPDLNGRIWFIPGPNFTSCTVGINANAKIAAEGFTQQQPIYYPPAVNAFEAGANKYDLYAFGSGTAYEQASTVTGASVGDTSTTTNFLPSLYIVIKDQAADAATTDEMVRIPIGELYAPEDLTADTCKDAADQELYGTWNQRLCKGTTHVLLGRRTQLTSGPALFVPVQGAVGDPVALFLLYDPDTPGECAGKSYILKLTFAPGTGTGSGTPAIKESVVYGAGAGAASGFAVAGNSVIIAKSAVGSGQRAGVTKVPDLNPTAGMSNPTPIWWRELK
jgi:hypothetical protein